MQAPHTSTTPGNIFATCQSSKVGKGTSSEAPTTRELHDAKQDIPAAVPPQKPSNGSTPTVENANEPTDTHGKTTTVTSKNSNFRGYAMLM